MLVGLLSGPASAQSVEVILPDTTYRVDSPRQVRSLLTARLASAGTAGSLGSIYRLRALDWNSAPIQGLQAQFDVVASAVPPPDTVVVRDHQGVGYPQLAALLRAANPAPSSYLFSAGRPTWQVRDRRYFGHGSGYGVLYDLVDVAPKTVQVLAGYDPPGNGSGGLVGEVTLELPNFLGALRFLRIHWRRLSQVTQTIDLSYSEPWLPLVPLGAQLAFTQDLRDTLYIQRGMTVLLTSLPGQDWSVALGAGLRNLNVLPHGTAAGLVSHRRRQLEISIQRQTLDHPANPSAGFHLGLTGRGGSLAGPKISPRAALGRVTLRATVVRSRVRLTWAQDIAVSGLLATRYTPQLPDFIPFGGSLTLRGYREDQFLVPWGVSSRTELRYRTGATSRLHLFADAAWLTDHGVLAAGGLGFLIQLGQNLLQLDLAWNGSDNFRTGKVHIRLINFISDSKRVGG